jgi:uncharacterized repeat protein (TIGR01451 family)
VTYTATVTWTLTMTPTATPTFAGNVSLTASAPVTHAYSGQAVTFTYVVTNAGSLLATNAALDVTIPKPYYLYNDPSNGTLSGDVLHVTLSDLAAGQSVTVQVGLRVDPNYKDEDKYTIPAELTYDQWPATGLILEGPIVMPTGQYAPGEMFIDVNVVRPGNEATITLMPGRAGYVRLKVYNSAGELVQTLEGQYPATMQEIVKRKWDGKNMHGQFVASGVYVVCADMPGVTKTGKVAVLR